MHGACGASLPALLIEKGRWVIDALFSYAPGSMDLNEVSKLLLREFPGQITHEEVSQIMTILSHDERFYDYLHGR